MLIACEAYPCLYKSLLYQKHLVWQLAKCGGMSGVRWCMGGVMWCMGGGKWCMGGVMWCYVVYGWW
jgi:hypothetical protein